MTGTTHQTENHFAVTPEFYEHYNCTVNGVRYELGENIYINGRLKHITTIKGNATGSKFELSVVDVASLELSKVVL